MSTDSQKKEETNGENTIIKQCFIIFIDKWMPAIITGVIVAIFVPYFQIKFSAQSQVTKRKVDLWESVGYNFTQYVEFHSQLVDVAKKIKDSENNKITPPEFLISQKSQFLQNRDQFANKLNSDIAIVSFYYKEPLPSLYNKYLEWISTVENATIENMPPTSEFYTWRDSMLLEMGKQLDIK
jgi:hypothetical protein